MTTTMNATSSSILFTSRNAGSALIATSFFTASDVEKKPPTKNSSVATTNEARYLARYRPNGWSPSVLRLEKRPPTINTISLEQSAMECTDSESMADDPVKNAASSFAMATPMFAPNAALTAAPDVRLPAPPPCCSWSYCRLRDRAIRSLPSILECVTDNIIHSSTNTGREAACARVSGRACNLH